MNMYKEWIVMYKLNEWNFLQTVLNEQSECSGFSMLTIVCLYNSHTNYVCTLISKSVGDTRHCTCIYTFICLHWTY